MFVKVIDVAHFAEVLEKKGKLQVNSQRQFNY